jgi:hypothetical protein
MAKVSKLKTLELLSLKAKVIDLFRFSKCARERKITEFLERELAICCLVK